ncbi:MAG: extracellular solute-binding protein [Candidatus Cohnella colombiensis]|uniref:Extracellular solute-binding protein n=1 Tax=Candidatus Cohnella colombiensis TaxID=3121368 RepID=A0AA95EU56_9BACL|nr:MAG: extracellular solute-binding protein [Cohnella sp.]
MNTKRAGIRKWIFVTMSLTLLIPILAACNFNKAKDADTRHVLRVGVTYGSKTEDSYIRQQYTDMYEITHTNVDIEIVPAIDYNEMEYDEKTGMQKPIDVMAKVKAIMTGDNPVDVMIVDMGILSQMVNENLLKQLEPLMKEDGIESDSFVPTVIEGIKDQGDGYLYALASTFMPSALYYNKKLFEKANVDAPTNEMSWDDVFNLAKRMKSGEGADTVFGFSISQWGSGENFYEFQNFTQPLQLKMYDDKAETMTVNSPLWENYWTKYYDLYKSHIMPRQDDIQEMYNRQNEANSNNSTNIYNPYTGRMFLTGNVAMAIGDYSLVNEIQQMNSNSEKYKIDKLEFDVVSMPYFNENPGVGGTVYFNTLAGINANAQNPEDAWDFIKFMTGKEWAKLKSRSTYEMSALKDYVKVREGMDPFNIEAFTTVKPTMYSGNSLKEQEMFQQKPNLNLISQYGNKAFSDMMQGVKTPKEALAWWQTRGTDILQKIKTQPTGEIDGVSEELYGDGGMYGGGRPMPFDHFEATTESFEETTVDGESSSASASASTSDEEALKIASGEVGVE